MWKHYMASEATPERLLKLLQGKDHVAVLVEIIKREFGKVKYKTALRELRMLLFIGH